MNRPLWRIIATTSAALIGVLAGGLVLGSTVQAEDDKVARPSESHLNITMDNGKGRVIEGWLDCNPDAGTYRNHSRLCAKFNKAFAAKRFELREGEMCSMMFYGPETATINGRWKGEEVNLSFSRTNSCTNARWVALEKIFS